MNTLQILKTKSAPGAVTVSYRLQLWTVIGLTSVGLAQLLFLAILYGTSSSGVEFWHWLSFLGPTVFPLLVLAMAYVLTPPTPIRMNRLFMAMLKTIVVVTSFSLLQLIKNQAVFVIFRLSGNGTATGPSWLTAIWSDYILMLISLIGFYAVMFTVKTRKK